MAVTRLEFTKKPFAGGRSFGSTGPYELLDGAVHFAMDPRNPLNQVITDIDLAQRGEDGRVHASADFCMLRPQDPARGNRRLFLDVLNRGNKVALNQFDQEPSLRPASGEPAVGDGWLLRQGYTVVWSGWQHDVPDEPGRMRITVPEALERGKPLTGKVFCQFQPNERTQVLLLSHNGHRPYPVADVNEPGAVLQVRDFPDAPAREIPRARWSFARLDGEHAVPDNGHICYVDGFQPGKHYEVVYTAVGAPLTGLGLAATRDVASFLRYASKQDGNPCAGQFDHVLAFGASQSGGFLRTLLYLGLCEDEEGRLAFDGLLPHIAGSFRGEFNWRFGQPSYYGAHTLAYVFPYTDALQTEPATGLPDGLQRRATERGKAPKVIYTNTSSEYWYLNGALTHTALDGSGDAKLPDNVRIYHFAGAQHGRGVLPLTDSSPLQGTKGVYHFNSLDYSPLLRAALVNLDRWVTEGQAPPPSRHPRLADGTLVERESLRERVARTTGARTPVHLSLLGRLDYGPEMSKWRHTQDPPKMGPSYPMRVPQVDDDGNDLGGIRHPDVAVPLATYTGWNLRHADIGGADQILGLSGATLPFPRTAAQRAAKSDPRSSIKERYASREAYLDQVRAAAQKLVGERYLLEDDVTPVVEHAAQRYDLFTK